jgi:hypothetical protein
LRNSALWQTIFIRDNFPVIGYYAWKGYKQTGWGILICNLEPLPVNTDLRLQCWNFVAQFVSGQYIADYLRELAISPVEVAALLPMIEQCNPQKEIMLLMRSGKSVEVCWLKNLASSPLECYGQVLDRWDEFMFDARDHASL